MAGLTNKYVENLIKCISPLPTKFKYVLPCDFFVEEMKKKKGKLKKGDCYIINQSASNHSGSHFVAVFITSKTTAEYFDSYAIPFSIDKNLVEAFDIGKLEIQQFEKTIQSPKSQFCGIFCIAYLLSKQIDMKTEVFADLFAKENLLKNDKIALEIVKTFIQNLKY